MRGALEASNDSRGGGDGGGETSPAARPLGIYGVFISFKMTIPIVILDLAAEYPDLGDDKPSSRAPSALLMNRSQHSGHPSSLATARRTAQSAARTPQGGSEC